jgi:hypothetical protein
MVDAVAYLEQRSTADEQAGSRHLTWPKKADLIGNQRKSEKNDEKERWMYSSSKTKQCKQTWHAQACISVSGHGKSLRAVSLGSFGSNN